MSNLVVVAYPDQYRAAEVLASLRRLNKEYLIDFDDACYVTKDASGKIKLHQNTSLTGAAAAWGGMWGMLIGLLFFVPFLGLAIGAGLGALSGKLADYGIDDNFAKQLTQTLQPNSSAIFVLVRKATVDKVLPEVAKYGGTVLQTSLPKETEEKLQAALNQGGGEQVAQAQAVAESQPAAATQAPPQAGATGGAQ
ncbi:MAG TPA: DUF1269 domain-containing protein [Ktedonobacterales bacterium]|jgi:uncharacterized membrane protein|nr:DUF1269 domain-containing protein [Ktedonobacterales bacterium]